ncbi:hypothetical protein [uncultured Cyclobacterium sp.]|uniref:hypothetical protein n=1 Tax=uncultured Cyclobacterium sp. TaxID=453820 RepID=UPI0030EBC42C
MNRLFFNSDLSKRKINFFFQTILVLVLYYNEISELIPLKLILWQIVHFSLIAIIDFYLDDYPYKKEKILWALFSISIVFLTISLFYGVFNAPYIRIHLAILILGNIFGGKVDKPFWKLLTMLNLLILFSIEFSRNELYSIFGMALLYASGAIFLLAITERISERNRSFWMVHALALFLYINFKGPFYEEAFIFLVGGIAYELAKILIAQMPKLKPL